MHLLSPIQPKFIELAKLWQQLEYKLIIMSEINTVNEQLMLLSDVVSKRAEIAAKLMERGDCVDIEPKSKGSEANSVDSKIAANTNNELISIVVFRENHDTMKVRALDGLAVSMTSVVRIHFQLNWKSSTFYLSAGTQWFLYLDAVGRERFAAACQHINRNHLLQEPLLRFCIS